MRETISVEVLIQYLKKWCVKPEEDDQERPPADQTVGANFTSTVQHIHNVYNYLQANCSQSSLKELFQHTPAVFVESNRLNDKWCSGRFYHLKEVCWSDNTAMFQRYRQLTHRADRPIQDPRVLAPFYSQLDGMRDFFTRLLNVDQSPTMNQYVILLELICSSAPVPTAEVLQDVSVLYAKLAQKCKPLMPGDLDGAPQYKLNPSYCSSLKGMVFDKKVFPTKDNSWVSLARKPMISDDKELEKVFKAYKNVCLLNLPPPEKKAIPKSRTGHAVVGEQDTMPSFNERDRLVFLRKICGVQELSQCVKSEPQTESLRPCPSMQTTVRSVIPYIQRFLRNHDELNEVYSELVYNNIAEKIKHLKFGQVGKLYIRYQLDVADSEDTVIELKDVICLLKDEKELYIQKDHLTDTMEICSELVKLFCTDSRHRKELRHFLSGLIASLSDAKSLKRFLTKEDIGELPSNEEQWEVPEPVIPAISLDRVVSRGYSSSSPEELARPPPTDGEQTLVCWPPRASIQNTCQPGQVKSSVVEDVLKMWPPPAGPKDKEPEKDFGPGGKSYEGEQPARSSSRSAALPGLQSHLGQPHTATVTTSTPRPPEHSQQSETSEAGKAEVGERNFPAPSPPAAEPAKPTSDQPTPNNLAVLDTVVASGTFQGTAEAQRPPLNLDFPLWNKDHATLEDMELTCQRPPSVVILDEQMDLQAIGEWGEQLVHSFLCNWRDGGDPGRPAHILWCNQGRESGQPYDFKLTFGAGSTPGVVFIEVKSTVKKEKSFIQLSANELDFALKEKDRYHIYRVYSAGDAQGVRLCRIRNLAQHLHTKDLGLYLFV
ncbi:uncharacterized protein LOC106536698 [Austrofundulus limnaeus]|uniref:Uncharacterized protein LOC106536698 n=1 Tax=Austrofundulus limnaeus TaxID=52670 RepID=A0A2I4DB66_AUSLI|nr:PREDICTED: uncharacterized protein LOC106536698 [Austrofundulus limnaeus]